MEGGGGGMENGGRFCVRSQLEFKDPASASRELLSQFVKIYLMHPTKCKRVEVVKSPSSVAFLLCWYLHKVVK